MAHDIVMAVALDPSSQSHTGHERLEAHRPSSLYAKVRCVAGRAYSTCHRALAQSKARS